MLFGERFRPPDLKLMAESGSPQLRAWADSLQDSDIKGQRHLNRRTRQADQNKQRATARQRGGVLTHGVPAAESL
jgi:hypothetical protein